MSLVSPLLEALQFPLKLRCPHNPKVIRDVVDEYYQKRVIEAWGNVHPLKGRSACAHAIKMRSNDYLCLASDQRVIAAEVAALREYGHGDSVSRVWLHHEDDVIHRFEKRTARLMGAEASVLCNSGYCANVGLIQSIAKPETPVYIDMKAHLSLWEGIKSAGACAVPFRHNDAAHLERMLKRKGPGIVVVDSLYSIDGDICPLIDIVDVTELGDSAIIVDETHSFGTHGTAGSGLVAAVGLAERVHFRTVGLSKSVASRGGIVVCSKRNAEFIRYESLPAIFSTSVLAHEVAGYGAVLDIFELEPWRREKLHKNHYYLKGKLDQLGYNVEASRSQIIALEAGDIRQTVKLRDCLESRGVFGAIFFPPATPEKRCLIRFTVNCGLTKTELDQVVSVCKEIREEAGLETWPSSHRQRRSRANRKPSAATVMDTAA